MIGRPEAAPERLRQTRRRPILAHDLEEHGLSAVSGSTPRIEVGSWTGDGSAQDEATRVLRGTRTIPQTCFRSCGVVGALTLEWVQSDLAFSGGA